MKKKNVINLIKYYVDQNDLNFRREALEIANLFEDAGDYDLSDYIYSLLNNTHTFVPQTDNLSDTFFERINLERTALPLPKSISDDIVGVINAINHNIGVNKFLFEGEPGTGKTESTKHIARILERELLMVNFSQLVDSRLGQSAKNIEELFNQINNISNYNKYIILLDEIDAIALDRINDNDIREMGRVTSTLLKQMDKLNSQIVIIATTNLFSKLDKALIRRFDAVINFNRYEKNDLIDIAGIILTDYLESFPNVTKNLKLFKKIVGLNDKIPYPGDLKNIIRSSLAFSNPNDPNDYFKRLYLSINKKNELDIKELQNEGFTLREIEILSGVSKSTLSRDLRRDDYE